MLIYSMPTGVESNERLLIYSSTAGEESNANIAIIFQHYGGGVYGDEDCTEENVDHAVVVVGYGTHQGRPYWLIKNR